MYSMDLEERARMAEELAQRDGFNETARAFAEIRKELARLKSAPIGEGYSGAKRAVEPVRAED